MALEELSRVARDEYGLAGAVQHGASTLSADAFDAFPRVGACEIHLATNFQNMVYDHPAFPAALKDEMYAWVREHAQEEKKANDTEEQFLYKARKKAIGPFKQRLWNAAGRRPRGHRQDARGPVRVPDGQAAHQRHRGGRRRSSSRRPPALPSLENARQAAAGTITAEERKAEGLAD